MVASRKKYGKLVAWKKELMGIKLRRWVSGVVDMQVVGVCVHVAFLFPAGASPSCI